MLTNHLCGFLAETQSTLFKYIRVIKLQKDLIPLWRRNIILLHGHKQHPARVYKRQVFSSLLFNLWMSLSWAQTTLSSCYCIFILNRVCHNCLRVTLYTHVEDAQINLFLWLILDHLLHPSKLVRCISQQRHYQMYHLVLKGRMYRRNIPQCFLYLCKNKVHGWGNLACCHAL